MPRHIINQARYLGENLKRLRRSRDLTVERLADAVGVSKAYISLVETGKRVPHWMMVMRMVHALGTTLCRFFTVAEKVQEPEDGIRSRREDRIVIEGEAPDERGIVLRNPTKNYTHILTPWHPGIQSEVVEIVLAPHTEWTPEPITFGGHVSAWSAEGRLLLVRGGTEYIMYEGECLAYDALLPHQLRNYTDDPVRAVLMITPVSF